MQEIFEMIIGAEGEEEPVVTVGLRLKLGGQETICPVSRACHSYEALETEVQAIKNNLESILGRAKGIFREPAAQEGLALGSHMEAEEIWSILSEVGDEDLFIEGFNGLEEAKRREVAEHVLTKCNIFSGRASVFSSRYNNETALME